MTPAPSPPRPHTQRWAYKWLYSENIFATATRLYPVFGRRIFRAVSRAVATFYSHTQPGVTRTVEKNLSLLGIPGARAAARRAFANYGAILADYVAVGAMPAHEALSLCGAFDGRRHIESLAPRGAILATAHFGFFEFGAVVLSAMGFPVTVATLAEPSPALTRWRADWRRRFGAETVAVGADPFSPVALFDALSRGRLVAVLADRPLPGQSVPVEAPGGTIPFSASPALLALLSGLPVVPVAVTPDCGRRYRLCAAAPVRVTAASREHRRQAVAAATRSLAAPLIQHLRAAPDLWFQFAPIQSSGNFPTA